MRKKQELIDKFAIDEKSLTADEKEILNEIYLDRMETVYEEVSKSARINIKEIKKIVTPVSLVSIEEDGYNQLPIFKSLQIFRGVKEVFLLYTLEAKERFETIETILERKKIKVQGQLITNELENVYSYLKNLAIKDEINSENTVIDITLGMKILGVALYKIAAERGIKAINWKEEFIIKDGKSKRNPFETSLELLKEPILESLRNRENINRYLKTAEYRILSDYYGSLGKEDCAMLFDEIDKVFNFRNLLNTDVTMYGDISEFREALYNFVDFYVNRSELEESTKQKMDRAVLFFLFLSMELVSADNPKYRNLKMMEEKMKQRKNITLKEYQDIKSLVPELKDATNEKDGDKACKGEKISIEKSDTSNNKNFVDEDVSDEAEIDDEIKIIYEYLKLKFLNMKSDKYGVSKGFLENLSLDFEVNFDQEKSLDGLIKYVIEEYKLEESVKILNFEENFIEDTNYQIKVENSVLKIEKFDIEIDLVEIENFKDKKSSPEKRKLKKEPQFLVNIIETKDKKYDKVRFAEVCLNVDDKNIIDKFITEKERENNLYSKYSKNKTEIGKYKKLLNDKIKEKMEQSGKHGEDFIVEKNADSLLIELEVNKYYYKLD